MRYSDIFNGWKKVSEDPIDFDDLFPKISIHNRGTLVVDKTIDYFAPTKEHCTSDSEGLYSSDGKELNAFIDSFLKG